MTDLTRAAEQAPSDRFLWGVATSAYQVEGNNVNTDIWAVEQIPGGFFKEASGDACDHYHRCLEDIRLFAKLGFNSYRFSVEWARVEPIKGQFSHAELDHYTAMAQACRDNGMTPCITLHHFSSPLWLAKQGGWESPETPELFARYARTVAERIGPLAGAWFTINEINLPPQLARYRQNPAFAALPRLQDGLRKALRAPNFSCLFTGDPPKREPVFIRAHKLAAQATKSCCGTAKIGMPLALRDHQAVPGGESKLREIQATDYAPYFELAKQDDFMAIQSYSRIRVGASGELPRPKAPSAHRTTASSIPNRWKTPSAMPQSKPANRFGLQKTDGIPIEAYFHSIAFDTFQGNSGYGPKFGLITVDRKTFARTPKPSAQFLIASSRMVRGRH